MQPALLVEDFVPYQQPLMDALGFRYQMTLVDNKLDAANALTDINPQVVFLDHYIFPTKYGKQMQMPNGRTRTINLKPRPVGYTLIPQILKQDAIFVGISTQHSHAIEQYTLPNQPDLWLDKTAGFARINGQDCTLEDLLEEIKKIS